MPKIKNISPLGSLDVPLLRRVLGPGEEIEVSEEVAARLLKQKGNYSSDWAPPAGALEEPGTVADDSAESQAGEDPAPPKSNRQKRTSAAAKNEGEKS